MDKQNAIEIIEEYLAIKTKSEDDYNDMVKFITKIINNIDNNGI